MGDDIEKWLSHMNKWDNTVGETLGIEADYTYIQKFNAWENNYKIYQNNLAIYTREKWNFVMNTNMNTVEEILNENDGMLNLVNKESFIKVLNIFLQQLLVKSSIINKSKDNIIAFSRTTLNRIEIQINNIIHHLNDKDVSYTQKFRRTSLVKDGIFSYSENENEDDKAVEGEYIFYNYTLIFINKIVKEYNKRKNNLSFLESYEMKTINTFLGIFAYTILIQIENILESSPIEKIENILEHIKKKEQELQVGTSQGAVGGAAPPGAVGGAARPAPAGAVGGAAAAAAAASGAGGGAAAGGAVGGAGAQAGQKPPTEGWLGSFLGFKRKPPNSGKSRKTLKVSERRKNTRKVV
jgi:hypothetical protein